MDDTDRKLMLLMYEDPRMPVQELAKRLKTSRQTVNHRMQALTRLGVFKNIRAAISIHYLGLVPLYIWGRTSGTSIEDILDRFEGTELVDAVIVLGGSDLLIVGAPRKEFELEDYIEFVRRTAEMTELTVGKPCYGDGSNPPSYDKGRQMKNYRDVSPIDLKIIVSLDDNARKPVAEIASDVGASTRTVRRHLERMKLEGVLTFDMPWDIPSGEDMYTLMYLNIRSGADKAKIARRLLSRNPLRVTVVRSFSNLPHFLMGLLKSDGMKETRKILSDISNDEDILSVTPNLIYLEREYWSWDQKLPAALARIPEHAGRHHTDPGVKKV
jgi:DNA-binding Lrp family transcriptional regulator